MQFFSVSNLRRYGKPVVFAACLIPFAWLVFNWWQAFAGNPHDLGFNPNETSNRFSGDWALRFLLVTLALTPLSKILRSPKPVLFRRMLGLFAFFYVCVHMLSYLWLDLLWDWAGLWADIIKRVYITVGMAAFLLLIPLAVTSTKGMIKRIGAKRWQRLHRLIYIIAPLAVLHFFMMRKGFQIEPLVYGAIFLALMAFRVKRRRKMATSKAKD